ncbi:ABC transporter ATP-binding protein [Burkholderia sp.]|uniref:ABC transporter ATP-binding protein n=1 Tax=Burkholderia sp. TaxID=36773 RepID=UPI0025C6BA5B|nr:ABC transporter ATP-binding protein [Burkholderia sp.]MBS6359625.1 ABC transporter ATP-binding protein [Burkholderia sp.]
MIELVNICKKYEVRDGKRTVLSEINCTIERGEHVGILGKNGAGKSTLIRLISGTELPTSGQIKRGMSVSWPLAFSGGFQGSLTGLDNLRFICRVYNTSYQKALPFVEEFTELGKYLREPVKRYSNGMRAKLAFAMSMAVEFDCFLIDEVIAVGDSEFQRKCHTELFGRRANRAMIMVSHDPHMIREHCSKAYVLDSGELKYFPDVDSAYSYYETPRQS